MKRLISADDVKKAYESGTPIHIDKNTIVTPQAKDVAREKKVLLIEGDCCCKSNEESKKCNTEKPVIEEKVCCAEQDCSQEEVLSSEEIYKILKAGIQNHLFTEEDLKGMLRGLDE